MKGRGYVEKLEFKANGDLDVSYETQTCKAKVWKTTWKSKGRSENPQNVLEEAREGQGP